MKAIYNWSKCYIAIYLLYSVYQRYNFESNLQHPQTEIDIFIAVFGISKIQFWKQFTTSLTRTISPQTLYSVYQRYNFESNLQHDCFSIYFRFGCIRYIKDTILKAIYNLCILLSKISWLYSVYQRYNFESNLQRTSRLGPSRCSCIRYIKDTILKAIYNGCRVDFRKKEAVFGISKIQFWKQFTTHRLYYNTHL